MVLDVMYLLLMLPGLVIMLWAQHKVRQAYNAYRRVPNWAGITGAQAARLILDGQGLYDVPVEVTAGQLTDHYDPRHRVLRLSPEVYRQPSVAALGIAAHEAGHAIQHARAYAPLQVRSALVPVAGVGSNLGFVLIITGLALQTLELAWAGVGFFAFATLFALVTLPVEFDASWRAQNALARMGLVTGSEAQGVSQVLNAAAWTYVAGFAISVLQLLYWISVVGSARRSTA